MGNPTVVARARLVVMSFWEMVILNERFLDRLENVFISFRESELWREYNAQFLPSGRTEMSVDSNMGDFPDTDPGLDRQTAGTLITVEAIGNGWILDVHRVHCTQGRYWAERQLFLDPNELMEFISLEVSLHYDKEEK